MIAILLKDRFEVTVRQDALAIVEDFELIGPAIVLLDLEMPKIDGLSAARLLKSRHPEARIVFMSGDTRKATIAAAERAGGCAFVGKHLAASLLIPALEGVLQSQSNRALLAQSDGSRKPTRTPAKDLGAGK